MMNKEEKIKVLSDIFGIITEDEAFIGKVYESDNTHEAYEMATRQAKDDGFPEHAEAYMLYYSIKGKSKKTNDEWADMYLNDNPDIVINEDTVGSLYNEIRKYLFETHPDAFEYRAEIETTIEEFKKEYPTASELEDYARKNEDYEMLIEIIDQNEREEIIDRISEEINENGLDGKVDASRVTYFIHIESIDYSYCESIVDGDEIAHQGGIEDYFNGGEFYRELLRQGAIIYQVDPELPDLEEFENENDIEDADY